jgi:hypothetical protein
MTRENCQMTNEPDKNMTHELKPCPFCESDKQAVFPPTCTEKSVYDPTDRPYPVVQCSGCGAKAVGKNWDQSCKSAWAAWNRRALSAAKGEPVDEEPGETISAYEFMAREFDRLAVLRKMWSADEVANIIRRMAVPSPTENRQAKSEPVAVKALVPSKRLEQLIGSGEATSSETHDMAVELILHRRALASEPAKR